MDYKELAKQIVSSGNPYEEFDKQASSLDDVKKTALAREVNKQFFLSKIDGKDADGDINFDVIEPPITGTHNPDSAKDEPADVEKTASDNGSGMHITDSMFVVKPSKRMKAKSTNTDLLMKVADHNLDDALDRKKLEEATRFGNVKTRLVAYANELRGEGVEMIAKIASDESTMRSVVATMIEHGGEKYIDDVISASSMSERDIIKVASVDIEAPEKELVAEIVDGLKQLDRARAIIKTAEEPSHLDKIAFIGGLAVKTIGTAAKTLLKGGKLAGKTAVWGVKNPGKTTAVLSMGSLMGKTQANYQSALRRMG